jgi:PAS domain S-box-containing protein
LEGTTLCQYAISAERPLVIPDTRADPLYRNVPTVESLGVAAYLGVPIRTAEGHALGSFCAIDFQPREWTGTEVEVMVELAASAEREIALRRDIRRQRQAAERTHFQAQLLDSVGEAVIATDPAGTITYWNRAAEQLYGWAGGEVLGRGIVEVTPAALSKTQASEIVGHLAAGQPWSGEFPVIKRDGTQFPAWVTNTPIMDASGRVTGIVGVSRDLTARKQAESALQESEERYRSIFEGAAEGFFLIRVESGGGFRYLAMNPALERITGIPRDRFIGRGPGEVLPPDAAARLT